MGTYRPNTRSKTKADDAKPPREHNPASPNLSGNGQGEQFEDTSDDEVESKLDSTPFRQESSRIQNAGRWSPPTSRNLRVGRSSQQLRSPSDDEGRKEYDEPVHYQKSPQLGRRPLPKAKQDIHDKRYEKQLPQKKKQNFQPESAPNVTGPITLIINYLANFWSNLSIWQLVLIVVAVAVIAGIASYTITIGQQQLSSVPSLPVQVLESFQENHEMFASRFPSQSTDNWRKIRSAVKATTAFAEPRSPGVIALVSLEDGVPVANCMGRTLASKLRVAYNDTKFVHLRGKDYEGMDADNAKMEMDERIRDGLRNGAHVVLLEGLHRLPPTIGLLFHGLCDTDNAPFKQAIYIFTSVTDEIVALQKNQQVTTFWKKTLSEDKRHSLETRIGNNIIVVNPEKYNFDKECS